MKVAAIKNYLPTIISYLLILLFVYAAVSKLTDFHNFTIQVAQSPLLTAFAGYIAVGVVASELIISILLSFSRTRLMGLHGSFSLMVLFTIYIYLILNFSPYVPCSCGGVLEEMGWIEHLYFNIIFCVMAAVGIYFAEIQKGKRKVSFAIKIAVNSICCTALMIALFLSSENIIHKSNNFIRRFPPFPAKRAIVKDLKFTSYYFAGADDSLIYLGNRTAPALVTVVDTSLHKISSYSLNVHDTLFKFRNVQLRIIPPNFYLYDGTVPCIFTGDLTNRDAILVRKTIPGFTKAAIVDTGAIIARTLSPVREHRLSKLYLNNVFFSPLTSDSLLQKQKDGFFDTDGEFHFDHHTKKLVYSYYYRNQYIVADDNLKLITRGNTIDTTTVANIKTEFVGPKKIKKFAAPPLMVNRVSTLYRNLLFINSTLPSRYESEKMWKDANVIDVYDVNSTTYLMSFYVYKVDGGQPDFLLATNNHLFVLFGSKLVSYRFNNELKSKILK